ncbi:MAG: tRNA pseudouridine(65) synthase TruC [Thiolinea sp.]
MLDILYQDEHIVAINKPSGLLVHRSLIDARETRFAIQLTRDQIGKKVYPVHRLDKPTSGILLFALSSETARTLTTQFTAREVQKKYLAVVRGYTEESGEINYALKEKHDDIADADADPDKAAQAAITRYHNLKRIELPHAVGRYPTARYSLLELTPLTGRRHQIRRHMKHIFHPIVGDTTHGDGRHNQFFRTQFDCHRLLLHARSLQLLHPVYKTPLAIYAPLPPDFNLAPFAAD